MFAECAHNPSPTSAGLSHSVAAARSSAPFRLAIRPGRRFASVVGVVDNVDVVVGGHVAGGVVPRVSVPTDGSRNLSGTLRVDTLPSTNAYLNRMRL